MSRLDRSDIDCDCENMSHHSSNKKTAAATIIWGIGKEDAWKDGEPEIKLWVLDGADGDSICDDITDESEPQSTFTKDTFFEDPEKFGLCVTNPTFPSGTEKYRWRLKLKNPVPPTMAKVKTCEVAGDFKITSAGSTEQDGHEYSVSKVKFTCTETQQPVEAES